MKVSADIQLACYIKVLILIPELMAAEVEAAPVEWEANLFVSIPEIFRTFLSKKTLYCEQWEYEVW